MSNYMEAAFAPAEAKYREAVLQQTWGHLAPRRNKKYHGRIVYSFGVFDSGHLNPTVLVCALADLDSSPWFYDNLHEFLDKEAPKVEDNVGKVFEWKGYFRNYRWCGTFRQLHDLNEVKP